MHQHHIPEHDKQQKFSLYIFLLRVHFGTKLKK